MNYFYGIQIPGLRTSVTLCNFPCVSEQSVDVTPVYYYVTVSRGSHWEVVPLGELKPDESVTVRFSDLPLSLEADDVPICFLYPELLPRKLQQLPNKPFMQTLPQWRGNLQLSSETTSVSFQSEYPGEMLGISKGSLLSICPMSNREKGIRSKLIFVNIKATPEKENRTLKIAGVRTRSQLATYSARTNSATIVPLEEFELPERDFVGAFSPDISGVPLYLNHTEDFSQLSFEHSHPPIELTIFGDLTERLNLVSRQKRYWLSQVANT